MQIDSREFFRAVFDCHRGAGDIQGKAAEDKQELLAQEIRIRLIELIPQAMAELRRSKREKCVTIPVSGE